jgi:hypothetical protein
MNHFDLRRDGFVLALLVLMVVLLVSALAGSYRAFGYALVVFLGDPVTWAPPVLATTVLLVAFAGMFTYETAAVHDVHDTLLGFQKGTAFLIYGVWIPAFFTMGVTFALVFDRLTGHQ